MTVPTGTILRVVAQMLWTDGEIMQNVYNAVLSGGGGPWTDEDVVDDAQAWLDNMYANVTTYVVDTLDGNQVFVYKYDAADDDWDEVGSDEFTWDPASAGDELPRGVAGLLNLQTEDPDVQGKKYIGGFSETSIIGGLLQASVVTALLALGADWALPFVGATSGATWTPGVWSIVGKELVPAVDTITGHTIMAYQRRRKRNVGV